LSVSSAALIVIRPGLGVRRGWRNYGYGGRHEDRAGNREAATE
jgi:hypothetical protein